MAHDFSIIKVVNPEGSQEEILIKVAEGLGKKVNFWGYADGAMYEAFDAQEFDAGSSGSYDGKIISQKEAAAGLGKAINLLRSYPDPTRADDLKQFLSDVVLPAPDSQKFYIHYG